MKKIQMVDLVGQYNKIKTEVDSGIQKVLNSASFINGPAVKEFQKNLENYLGVKHVIPCANGTDALQIALMGLGLKPGDEVITSNFTFVATVEVIALLGLKLVLVDADPNTFNIDPKLLRKAITPNTKAIVPVHVFGQGAEMEEIIEIANKNNIPVVEDNAQAIGSDYTFSDGRKQKLGTIGNIGCTSFFPSKNLGCFGDGGAIFTNDDGLAEKIRQITNHGSKVKYYHQEIGVNSRLDSIQAAVLNVKLKNLDNYCKARQEAAAYYDSAFAENKKITVPARSNNSTHVFHQYTLKLDGINRNELRAYLAEKEIPAMVYYPIPLHLQDAYLNLGYKKGDFPVTEALSEIVISLPMHTELEQEQQKFITQSVLDFIKN